MIVQIFLDKEILGLFNYESIENSSEVIEECFRKAEMAIQEMVTEEGEEESIAIILIEYLAQEGFTRIFVNEVYLWT